VEVKVATICELNLTKNNPDISYPCFWEYKIVFLSKVDQKEVIYDILKDKEFKLTPSKKSKKGSYESSNLTVFVKSEDERKAIFSALKAKPTIKFVL
jgi:putative lipoic acid-binding regulatory protein